MENLAGQLAIWRQKQAAGELTLEEQKEIIRVLRAGRLTAATNSRAAKAKKTIDVSSLEDEIDNL